MNFFGRIRLKTDLKNSRWILVFFRIQLSECDVVVKYSYKGDDYYEIGQTSTASNFCDPSKLKENQEYQGKLITITTLHRGNF